MKESISRVSINFICKLSFNLATPCFNVIFWPCPFLSWLGNFVLVICDTSIQVGKMYVEVYNNFFILFWVSCTTICLSYYRIDWCDHSVLWRSRVLWSNHAKRLYDCPKSLPLRIEIDLREKENLKHVIGVEHSKKYVPTLYNNLFELLPYILMWPQQYFGDH